MPCWSRPGVMCRFRRPSISAQKGMRYMRKYLLAAVAAAAVATPAVARDNSPYVGVEGGVLFPKDPGLDLTATFPVTTDPGIASGVNRYTDAADVDYKTGYDVDLIGGYDFG